MKLGKFIGIVLIALLLITSSLNAGEFKVGSGGSVKVGSGGNIILSSTGWLPTDIPGCVLWLRSDFAWQDAAKTVPCTNSSLIWTGEDKSGLVNDVIQATEAKRPTYLTNQINGHPAWRFDGIDDWMQAIFTYNLPRNLFLIIKQNTWSFSRYLCDGSIVLGMIISQLWASPEISAYTGAAWAPINTNLVVGSFGIVELRQPTIQPTILAVNEIEASYPNVNVVTDAGGITLGDAANFTGPGNIDFVEGVGFDNIISPANRQRLLLYFNTEAQGNGYAIY